MRAAGAPLGIADAGYHAIESMRLEKGYRAFGRELTPDYTPVEAGLVFATALAADKDFLGRDALDGAPHRARRGWLTAPAGLVRGRGRRSRCSGAESCCCATGRRVGQVTSAAWGGTVGSCVGLAYVRHDGPVRQDWLDGGGFEADVAGVRHGVRLSLRAPL